MPKDLRSAATIALRSQVVRLLPILLLLLINTLGAPALLHSAALPLAQSVPTRVVSLAAAEAVPSPIANFRRIDERDGLAHPAVYGSAQDSFGFLWFATLEGVNRFDGHEMRLFAPDPQATGAVCGGPKVALYVDRSDGVWIGSIGRGACMYDTLRGAWRTYFGAETSAEAVTVRDFLETADGTLWMATSVGLASLALGSETPTLLRNDPTDPSSLSHDDVYALAQGPDGTLWIGTRGGVNALNRATGQFTHYRHNPDAPDARGSLSSDRAFDVLVDRSGIVWIGTWDGGLNRLDPASGEVRVFRHDATDPHSIGSDQVMKLLEDSAGRLWIGTYGGGLNLLDGTTERFVRYQNDPLQATSLSHNSVVALYEDRTGMLWAGTEGGGVNVLNLFPLPFVVYTRGGEPTIAPGLVLAFAEDSVGRLLIGTNAGGVSRLDRAGGAFTYLQTDPQDPNSLATNVVSGLLNDGRGALWIGTSKGLNRYDAATDTFTLYQHDPSDPNSLSDNSVYQIVEAGDGTLWLSVFGGLNHFDPAAGRFTRHLSGPDEPQKLAANSARVLLAGTNGEIWIGTQNGGLHRLNRASGASTHYRSDPTNPASLSSNNITGLARDAQGMIWVATDDAGLNRLDPRSGAITRFGPAQGLADARVLALAHVVEPGEGAEALWMSTGRGIARFDLRTQTFRNYDASDGLPNSDFVPYAVYQGKTGELFFGAVDGFVAFQPAAIQGTRTPPVPQIAELYINNRPAAVGDGILPTAIFANEAISMPAAAQAITFLFATPGYWDSGNVRFRFRLDGFDGEWIDAQPMQRAATYTNIDPGSYTFRLQAAGRNGTWSEPGRALRLMLQPAWWQIWWVPPLGGLLGGLVILAAIASVFQTRLRLTRRRSKLLEKEVAASTTELSALLAVSQSITSERNLDPLLARVLESVRHAIPHSGAVVLLRNGDEESVQAYHVAGAEHKVEKDSVADSVFRTLVVEVGSGKLLEPAGLNGSSASLGALALGGGESAGAQMWLGAPLIRQTAAYGLLLLYAMRPLQFSDSDLPKLQRFASQLAVAVENARLQAQAQRLAVDLERSRLSRELHDSVTQLLHSISLHANAAERALALGRPAHGAENMRQAQHLAQEAIHELRTLIFELRLTPLEESGLQAALKAYLDTVVTRSGISVYLDAQTRRRWPQDVEFELYRIAQEALTNVVKHANASRVVVSLREKCDCPDTVCVTLEIRDTGSGFDVPTALGRGTVGLQSMAERAQKIGACLSLISSEGQGTTVTVELGIGTDITGAA